MRWNLPEARLSYPPYHQVVERLWKASRLFLTAMALLLAACGPSNALREIQEEPLERPLASNSATATSPFREPVAPTFKATISSGISPEIPQYVRTIPGVAAASRIALSSLRLSDGKTEAEVSVAAVDPVEFRPLSPEVTSRADFVWRGLRSREIVLAHEEHTRLGFKPGSLVDAKGPLGEIPLRIGGVAANGIPNLAGAFMSLRNADAIGLGVPTLLLVGLTPGADEKQTKEDLEKLLVGVRFQSAKPVSGRAFLAGKSAERAIGSFTYSSNPDGTITQDSGWVQRNIVSRKVPILGSVRCHRVLFPQLEAALKEIQSQGLTGSIDASQYGGCYVPRFIGRDENRPISMHAWGLAIDFNVKDNPQGAQPKMDPRVVEIFEQWGFRWGGRWSVPDGHHFELASLVR